MSVLRLNGEKLQMNSTLGLNSYSQNSASDGEIFKVHNNMKSKSEAPLYLPLPLKTSPSSPPIPNEVVELSTEDATLSVPNPLLISEREEINEPTFFTSLSNEDLTRVIPTLGPSSEPTFKDESKDSSQQIKDSVTYNGQVSSSKPFQFSNAPLDKSKSNQTLDGRFQNFLHNRTGIEYFMKYCLEDKTCENLLFWLEVEIFQG